VTIVAAYQAASTSASAAGVLLAIGGFSLGVLVLLRMVTAIRRSWTPEDLPDELPKSRSANWARINHTMAYGSWITWITWGLLTIGALVTNPWVT